MLILDLAVAEYSPMSRAQHLPEHEPEGNADSPAGRAVDGKDVDLPEDPEVVERFLNTV
jgi:hypothetical protein